MAKKARKRTDSWKSYRPAIVTFIDILGFKNIISTRSDEDISEIVRQVQWHAGASEEETVRKMKVDTIANWTRCIFFSDSVVRIRPIDSEYREGALFYELLSLVHAQAELALKNVFIRGGITVGDILLDGSTLFGPAMARAYELESSFANYPRIIVDPAVLEQLRGDDRLRSENHDIEQDIQYIRGLLRRSDDALWFVDYLKVMLSSELDDPESFPEVLDTHKQHIVAGASAAGGNLKTLQKYLWLAEYHNRVVAEAHRPKRFKHLRITNDDIPQFEDLSS